MVYTIKDFFALTRVYLAEIKVTALAGMLLYIFPLLRDVLVFGGKWY